MTIQILQILFLWKRLSCKWKCGGNIFTLLIYLLYQSNSLLNHDCTPILWNSQGNLGLSSQTGEVTAYPEQGVKSQASTFPLKVLAETVRWKETNTCTIYFTYSSQIYWVRFSNLNWRIQELRTEKEAAARVRACIPMSLWSQPAHRPPLQNYTQRKRRQIKQRGP